MKVCANATEAGHWKNEKKLFGLPTWTLHSEGLFGFFVNAESKVLVGSQDWQGASQNFRRNAENKKNSCFTGVDYLSLKVLIKVLESVLDLIFLKLPNLQTPSYIAC